MKAKFLSQILGSNCDNSIWNWWWNAQPETKELSVTVHRPEKTFTQKWVDELNNAHIPLDPSQVQPIPPDPVVPE